MATDLAEVLGSAIALNLLFGIPIMVAILVTVLDVFLLLLIMKLGIQKNRGYCFNLDFDHLGYLCLSGSLV
ncbi:MAG: divalent metal cation transporter [Streptococcus sp.]